MPVVQRVARTLARFVDIVSKFADDWEGPWFRGQDQASDSLTPRRYRYRWVDEDEIRAEFKRRMPQLTLSAAQPRSEWERYFLMQHYGVPTRLLDWSEGGLLALQFALISNPARNAAVWVLDPFWLNEEVAKLAKREPREVKR